MTEKKTFITKENLATFASLVKAYIKKQKKRERRIIFRKAIKYHTADDGRYEYAYVSRKPIIEVPVGKVRIWLNGENKTCNLWVWTIRQTDYDRTHIEFEESGGGGRTNYVTVSNNCGKSKVCIMYSIPCKEPLPRRIYIVKRYETDADGVFNIYLKVTPYNNERSYTGRFFVTEGALRCTDMRSYIKNFPLFERRKFRKDDIVSGLRKIAKTAYIRRGGYMSETNGIKKYSYRYGKIYSDKAIYNSNDIYVTPCHKYTRGLPTRIRLRLSGHMGNGGMSTIL